MGIRLLASNQKRLILRRQRATLPRVRHGSLLGAAVVGVERDFPGVSILFFSFFSFFLLREENSREHPSAISTSATDRTASPSSPPSVPESAAGKGLHPSASCDCVRVQIPWFSAPQPTSPKVRKSATWASSRGRAADVARAGRKGRRMEMVGSCILVGFLLDGWIACWCAGDKDGRCGLQV